MTCFSTKDIEKLNEDTNLAKGILFASRSLSRLGQKALYASKSLLLGS